MKDNKHSRIVVAVSCSALAAGLLGALVLSDGRLDGLDQTDRVDAHGTHVDSKSSGAAIASPFSTALPAANGADPGGNSREGAGGQSAAGQTSNDVPADTSQELHIAESRRNYARFLDQPDGYKKFASLAGVDYEHVPQLEKRVYDQYLSHHGRLAFDELLQDIRSHPDDRDGNADRYHRLLEIIAKMPCEPDENWDGCIAQTLGATRDDMQKAQAEADSLLAEQNLARLRQYGFSVDRGSLEWNTYRELYDSLAPLLASALEGDDRILTRFQLTADEAAAIVDSVHRQDHGTDAPADPS